MIRRVHGARGRSLRSVLRAARWVRIFSMSERTRVASGTSGGGDTRDDTQRTATHATVFDVDVEDALEPLHPAHGRGTNSSASIRTRLLGRHRLPRVSALLCCTSRADGPKHVNDLLTATAHATDKAGTIQRSPPAIIHCVDFGSRMQQGGGDLGARLRESVNDAGLSICSAAGVVQRSKPTVPLWIDIGPRLQESGNDLSISHAAGPVQRSRPTVPLCIDIGPRLQESGNDLSLSVVATGPVQRSSSIVPLCVDIGPRLQESGNDLGLSVAAGQVQRSSSIVPLCVDVGPRLQESDGDTEMSVPDGHVERRELVVIPEIDTYRLTGAYPVREPLRVARWWHVGFRAGSQECLDGPHVTAFDSDPERLGGGSRHARGERGNSRRQDGSYPSHHRSLPR